MQTENSVIKLEVNQIIPNKYQPRKVFDKEDISALAESIKIYGIINPILVRKKEDKYEIIAGERRFRAALEVGLTEVPVIVKSADEQQMAELALIENIQRQQLTAIEEAKSYEEIMKIGNQTQASLAQKIGKSQSSIANKMRLLTLPQEIQDALAHKKISERHARSLLSIEDTEEQLELLEKIINEKLTVKETEQLINAKDISEEEINNAIADIMKTLNITEEELEKEEKEDDNMNNGNFFPSFDNNNISNNNTSLNMMNMQSVAPTPMPAEQEFVMPTIAPPISEPQIIVPTTPVETPIVMPETPVIQPELIQPNFESFGPTMTATPEVTAAPQTTPMENIVAPQNNINNLVSQPAAPTIEAPIINDEPLFVASQEVIQPQVITPVVMPETPVVQPEPVTTAVVDTPLFNPEVVMPTVEQAIQESTSLEIPVVTPEPTPIVMSEPVITPVVDKFEELKNILTSNNYNFKVYSNETDNCIIIELPKN